MAFFISRSLGMGQCFAVSRYAALPLRESRMDGLLPFFTQATHRVTLATLRRTHAVDREKLNPSVSAIRAAQKTADKTGKHCCK